MHSLQDLGCTVSRLWLVFAAGDVIGMLDKVH